MRIDLPLHEHKRKALLITEILYDISIIEEVKKLDFDFNGLIDEFLTYRKETFGDSLENSLEVETE